MNQKFGPSIQQLKNSLENLQRELQNVQAKTVNLRLQEKNLIKIIKKRQAALKKALLPSIKYKPLKESFEGLFLSNSIEAVSDLFISQDLQELLDEPGLVNPDFYV